APWGARPRRPILVCRMERMADPVCKSFTRKERDELVMHLALDEERGARRAARAGIAEPAPDRRGRGLADVGVGEHDVRAFAAELERYALDPIGGGLEQARAGGRLARDSQPFDRRVGGRA